MDNEYQLSEDADRKCATDTIQKLLQKANKLDNDKLTDKQQAHGYDQILTEAQSVLCVPYEISSNEESELQHDWLDQFNTDVGTCGIVSKPTALRDMHAWLNPYGTEWEEASENYPQIATDLPKAIRKIQQSPYYWFSKTNELGDYLPEPVNDTDSQIEYILNDTLDMLKQTQASPCTPNTLSKLMHFAPTNDKHNSEDSVPASMSKLIHILTHTDGKVSRLNGIPVKKRLHYFGIYTDTEASQRIIKALHRITLKQDECHHLANQLAHVTDLADTWYTRKNAWLIRTDSNMSAWSTGNWAQLPDLRKISYRPMTTDDVVSLAHKIAKDIKSTEYVAKINTTKAKQN